MFGRGVNPVTLGSKQSFGAAPGTQQSLDTLAQIECFGIEM
jgi:hypothetical protein